MFSKSFLAVAWRAHRPYCLHLLSRDAAHFLIIEDVFAFLVLGGPEDGLGRVGEVTAAQVRGRVGFFPGDVVQNLEPELLQGVADAEYDVVRASHPDGAVGFQYFLAAKQPFAIEFVVQFRSPRDVPVAFIHLHHFAGVTGDAAIREEIRRVGEDGVEPALRIFGGDGVQ